MKYPLFVQLTISTILSVVYCRQFITMLWQLPLYVVAVVITALWLNLVDVKYKLKSKTANIRWCLIGPFAEGG